MSIFDNVSQRSTRESKKVRYASVDYNQYFGLPAINPLHIEYKNFGDLNITSGRLVVCDPLVSLCCTLPFTRMVPIGRFQVIVCVVNTQSAGCRHAIVKLEFSSDKAERWEMARLQDQYTDALMDEDAYFGFPVDAGLACICDVASQELYNQFDDGFMAGNPYANIYDDYLDAAFRKNSLHPDDPNCVGDWLNFSIPDHPDENVIMFSAGYGDGVYPCYWGLTANGDVCSLVIDFMVL